MEIYALDEQLSNWWQQLRPDFKLTPANLPAVSHKLLPKLLLMNITYHQSFCALHSSIVPLFCGLPGDHSWSSARQSSAQVAFDHACDVSALIQSALVSHPKRISALSLFLAYSAYCGCAIQIPFMWCLNETIKDRVHANVKANIRVIHILAPQWKFAEILVLIHRRKKCCPSLTASPTEITCSLPVQRSPKRPNCSRRRTQKHRCQSPN